MSKLEIGDQEEFASYYTPEDVLASGHSKDCFKWMSGRKWELSECSPGCPKALKYPPIFPTEMTLDQIKTKVIEDRLKYFKGRKVMVARSLGITTKTLFNWMHRFGIFDEHAVWTKEARERITGRPRK